MASRMSVGRFLQARLMANPHDAADPICSSTGSIPAAIVAAITVARRLLDETPRHLIKYSPSLDHASA
jgi:hypothetical protein